MGCAGQKRELGILSLVLTWYFLAYYQKAMGMYKSTIWKAAGCILMEADDHLYIFVSLVRSLNTYIFVVCRKHCSNDTFNLCYLWKFDKPYITCSSTI